MLVIRNFRNVIFTNSLLLLTNGKFGLLICKVTDTNVDNCLWFFRLIISVIYTLWTTEAIDLSVLDWVRSCGLGAVVCLNRTQKIISNQIPWRSLERYVRMSATNGLMFTYPNRRNLVFGIEGNFETLLFAWIRLFV